MPCCCRSKPETSEFRAKPSFPPREPGVVASSTSDNVIKITRKRPLSEAINYSDMMDEDTREMSKRGDRAMRQWGEIDEREMTEC